MIDWTLATMEETALIARISKRAAEEFNNSDRQAVFMDIQACHTHGTPLKLQELLEAEPFDFLHDIIGINLNLNHDTGEIENCFLPRYYDSKAGATHENV